jgi:tetratricopeptide (TPR) repeat protein
MKNIFLIIGLLTLSVVSTAQPAAAKQEILYGAITKENLMAAPFDKWFITNYDTYEPNAGVVSSLKKLNTKDISVQIFLGTWCGDSKREVPRFMKVLNELSFPLQKVQIVALGGGDSLYKQSPQHEEDGKGIFRVPVFIFYKNGLEINRINEYPAFSLEKDILTILSNKLYIPNYKSFETIKNWLTDGTLKDKNITARSLAWQLKPLVGGENELNSLGYLWLKNGKKEEALKIFQINAGLYPESANVISSLGEGYYDTGETKMAIQYLEKALELNKDTQLVKEILKILYKAKGIKE